MTRSLDELVQAVREADPQDRIELRNEIAAYGDQAIDAMADLLSDRRLASFAIRVLEQIGQQAASKAAATDALVAADTSDWPPHLLQDRAGALAKVGYRPPRQRSAGGAGERLAGLGGQPGRGYWVMRTSPYERTYVWGEAVDGRLRQGWGVVDEQNLEVIAEAIRRGIPLTGYQKEARGALRMLSSWHNGMRLGDIVVAPNLPAIGRFSVFELTGSYYWSPDTPLEWGERFGHVLPVRSLALDVDRYAREVPDGLRSAMRGQARLYNITGYGGYVEQALGRPVEADGSRIRWTEDKYEVLFTAFPPDGAEPNEAEADQLAFEFGSTRGAVQWQWADGAAYVQGRSASTTSQSLKDWLDATGRGPRR